MILFNMIIIYINILQGVVKIKSVLLIHPNLGNGGAEKMIVFVAESLSKRYNVTLATLEKNNVTLDINKNIVLKQYDTNIKLAIHE